MLKAAFWKNWFQALIALAFALIIGTERFHTGKQIASYLGLVPSESSGERRRLEHISKQDNSLLRFLLVEAWPTSGYPVLMISLVFEGTAESLEIHTRCGRLVVCSLGLKHPVPSGT